MASNSKQRDNWNGSGGQSWVRNQERIDQACEVFGLKAIELLQPELGERILDVGCGAGSATMALGHAVGEGGEVTGVDFSEPLLEVARKRCLELPQVQFVYGDAASADLGSGLDGWYSRFGVMFFDQPQQVFSRLGKALRVGGRLAFVCWQGRDQNPWIHQPLEWLLPFLPETPPPLVPNAPGAFGLADPDRTRRILSDAGYRDIQIEDGREDMVLSTSGAQQALEFCMELGPASYLTTDLSEEHVKWIRGALLKKLEGLERDRRVSLPAAFWVVSATR